MKKNRRRYVLISVVILLILVLAAVRSCDRNAPIVVETELAKKRTITEIVTASGKIQPETEIKISADVSGEVVELHVREGDRVKEGQLLLKINPDIYISAKERAAATLNSSRASLSNAKARLAQAEAQFKNAQSSFNRNKKLFDQGAISEAEFESAESQFEVAKGEFEAARQSVLGAEYSVNSTIASLREAEDQLRKTTIFAPVTGTVSKLNIEKGERVVGTLQMAGTEIMRIADLEEMEVNVEVNENDIVRVSLHDTADIIIDAYPGRTFKGMVTEIANSAKTDMVNADQVTNFEVKIRVMRPSYLDLIDTLRPHLSPFRPGMSATVDIRTRTASGVISVPIGAVAAREIKDSENEDLQEFVFLHESGKAISRDVSTGIQDNEYIQITKGLSEEDEVITGPYLAISRELKDSSLVEIKIKTDEETNH